MYCIHIHLYVALEIISSPVDITNKNSFGVKLTTISVHFFGLVSYYDC